MGWIMERPMDLNFQLFETATLITTVLVVTFMLQVSSLRCYQFITRVSESFQGTHLSISTYI